MNNLKKVETSHAPKAIGPYSQAILSGSFLFVSGQLPLDPKSGEMVKGDIKNLTYQVINNIEAILKEANTSLKNVVRVDIFLTDMKDFTSVNEVYAEKFSTQPYPARQTVQVVALPKGSPIEISCIAIT